MLDPGRAQDWRQLERDIRRGQRALPGPGPADGVRTVDDAFLQRHPGAAEQVLNAALQQQNWATLRKVLPLYASNSQHDPQLVRFMRGALLRAERRLPQAIALYQEMLAQEPALASVRLDLALMQLENKQYRDARQTLIELGNNPALDPALRAMLQPHLARIAQESRPWLTLETGLLLTDNANQATGDRYPFPQAPQYESKDRPRSSAGSLYTATWRHDLNVGGNHVLHYDAALSASSYFKSSPQNDRQLELNAGYKYQSALTTLEVMPLFRRRFVGGRPYSREAGLALSAEYWLSPRLRLGGAWRWFQRNYAEPYTAARYDGPVQQLSLTPLLLINRNVFVFGGMHHVHENLRADDGGSRLLTGVAALGYASDAGLTLVGGLRHGRRRYKANDGLMAAPRRDRISGLFVNVFDRRLQFWGLQPKLGLMVERVSSSLPTLYDKRTHQARLTLEREF